MTAMSSWSAAAAREMNTSKPARATQGSLQSSELYAIPPRSGIDIAKLSEAGERDEAIAEFCRFYEERREEEMEAAGSDARKRQKLSEDFTPRLDMSLVGLEGEVRRDLTVRVRYGFASGGDYESEIVVGRDQAKFFARRKPISALLRPLRAERVPGRMRGFRREGAQAFACQI